MKILYVIPYFVPAWSYGGPVKVANELSTRTAQKKHIVAVATTDVLDEKNRSKVLRERLNGVEVFRFKNLSNFLAKRLNLYLPLGFKKFAAREIKKYDVIHLHSFYTCQNVIAAKFCKQEEVPYILHLHESPVPSKERGRGTAKILYHFLWGKNLLLNSSRILALTTREKDELTKFLPAVKDKIVVLPNSISLQNMPVLQNKKEGQKIILSLSRLSYIKGIDLLIKAFAKLAAEDSSFNLVIAGPDERGQKRKLQRLVEKLSIGKNVSFIGEVTGEKKEKTFADADVYALFSRYESFGLTVLEAIKHNLPVCLSKEVGLSEDINKWGCGIIIKDTANEKAAAKALQQTYEQSRDLKKNCADALSQFDQKKIIDDLVTIYQTVVKKT